MREITPATYDVVFRGPEFTELIKRDVKIEPGESVRVTNEGGRLHTFTRVVDFGGGRVPMLNIGLTQAPECLAGVVDMPPGATITVDGLGIGTHKFQCCIHPWMRAAVKVLPDDKGKQA